jgi:RNA polymerase sigma-70 factor (ECF subfamily)
MMNTFDAGVLAHYRRSLYTYALKAVRDPTLAEDLVQETFLAALDAGDRFAGRASVRTWLIAILKHKIVDAFRERAKAPVSYDDPLSIDIAASVATSEPDPVAATACKRFVEACQRKLERMSAQAVRAFVLSEVLGHDSEEICAMLGISKANLWTTVHRARRALRGALAEDRPVRKVYRQAPTTSAIELQRG